MHERSLFDSGGNAKISIHLQAPDSKKYVMAHGDNEAKNEVTRLIM